MQVFTIKIKSAHLDSYWYAGREGSIFNVTYADPWLKNSERKFQVLNKKYNTTACVVDFDDCEILEGPVEVDESVS